jgi:F-type H+-transporting ATPase subunit b
MGYRGVIMLTRLAAAAVLILVALLCVASPVLAAEGGGGGTDALNPVNADGYNFRGDLSIWTAAVFLVVLAILYKAAWRPISEGLQKRESEIAGQIAEAQRKNEEARQLLADYEKKLAAAQDEVRGLVEQGRRDAEKIGQQMLDKAREEAGVERQRAVQQIESATLAALKELADRSATLAVDLAGKIVGARLKAADHSRLIEQAVSEFSRSGPAKVNGKSHG